MEEEGVKLCLFDRGGWYEDYRRPDGRTVDALECRDKPEEVQDVLTSYGIEIIDWQLVADGYLYY
jgi:hypothetical protein